MVVVVVVVVVELLQRVSLVVVHGNTFAIMSAGTSEHTIQAKMFSLLLFPQFHFFCCFIPFFLYVLTEVFWGCSFGG